MTSFQCADILGVGISTIRMTDALEAIDGWIAGGDRTFVCITGVHGVMESQHDDQLRHIHNAAGMVTPDGMPLVWLSRLSGYRHVERVYGPDLMLACCEESVAKGYRHFFYGGAEGVAERLSERLQKRFPRLEVVGTFCPPFRPLDEDEDKDAVRRINEARPDIVWVGMGTPKQERWMWDHRNRLDASVLIGVGAAFDFHSGSKKQAPIWMQRSGLEWFFRLLSEPRRLGPRYLVNNPLFLWKVLLQGIGAAKYPR